MRSLGRVRNSLLTLLLAIIVIKLAWITVEPMILPVSIGLLVITLLLFLYKFMFRT
jgi:hypothetical protein